MGLMVFDFASGSLELPVLGHFSVPWLPFYMENIAQSARGLQARQCTLLTKPKSVDEDHKVQVSLCDLALLIAPPLLSQSAIFLMPLVLSTEYPFFSPVLRKVFIFIAHLLAV
jgi:hypothetical protein